MLWNLPGCGGLIRHPNFFTLSEFPSRSSVLCLYHGCKKTKNDFSTTHSTCRQRRKSLGTDYPPVHPGITTPHNSMRMRKCRSRLQTTRRFWGIPIHPSSLDLGLSPSHLLYRRILPGSRLYLVRHDLWSFGEPIIK